MTTVNEGYLRRGEDGSRIGTAVAVVPPATPPAAIVEVDEGAGLHPGDIRPLMVRVMQGPAAGRYAGLWRYRDEGDEVGHDTITGVPLLVQPTRTKWPEGDYRDDARPVCWSNDGIRGATGAEYEGRACTNCPFYTPSPRTGDRQKGRCLPQYMAFLFDKDRQQPVMLRLAGTQTRAADPIIGGVQKGAKRSNTNLRRRWITMKTRQKKVPSGVIYEILVTPGVELEAAEQEEMRGLFDRARTIQAMLQPDVIEEEEVTPEPQARNLEGYTPSAPDAEDSDLPF